MEDINMQAIKKLLEITNLLKSLGEWSYGELSSLPIAAKKWLDTGIETDVIEAYIQAGAFQPNAALHLYMNGITPGMAARHYANGDSIAYAFSNNELSYRDIERFFEVH
jgi:hypothetical protein